MVEIFTHHHNWRVQIPKSEDRWNEIKRDSLNAEAMNALVCALSSKEFNRVCICNMAKRIWDILEVPREHTNQVKESKSIFLHINKSYLK